MGPRVADLQLGVFAAPCPILQNLRNTRTPAGTGALRAPHSVGFSYWARTGPSLPVQLCSGGDEQLPGQGASTAGGG